MKKRLAFSPHNFDFQGPALLPRPQTPKMKRAPAISGRPSLQSRSREPIASAARDSAMRVLGTVPPRAVVFAYGDNDTYPGWYLQQVEGVRRDVTLVTIPLLGAGWYRAEVARRYGLLPNDVVGSWRGFGATLSALCVAATDRGRAVIALTVRERTAIPVECEKRTEKR